MRPLFFYLLFALITIQTSAQYYADIFMDGGAYLSSKKTLFAADSLGLSYEYYAGKDSIIQNQLIIGSDIDYNGILLYPDGSPRFRAIYTNGGRATNHGRSLGPEGRKRIKDFYQKGGSYTGSCAGAFLSSMSPVTTRAWPEYYNLFPGRVRLTNVYEERPTLIMDPESPLLEYGSFQNNTIDSIYHWGGCYLRPEYTGQATVLMRFHYPGNDMHNQISAWSYKGSAYSGQVVAIGSHPEYERTGSGLELMKSILLYALDHPPPPHSKGVLQSGKTIHMNKSSKDNQPLQAKIGDNQIHHFRLPVTIAKDFAIDVMTEGKHPLVVELLIDDKVVKQGTTIQGKVHVPVGDIEGRFKIKVHCPDKVITQKTDWGYEYIDNLDLLNGQAYSIKASWK